MPDRVALPETALDRQVMGVALAMARRGLGTVAPNPSVGAVVFDPATGEVIARGWTQPGGRPHAETEALRRAGLRARGATLYVTLEPCSHHGRTPPCADAVIAAGISRVVVGIEDPDPRVAGRGIERMRSAGLDVLRGVCAREARWMTRGHIVRVTERRPFVQLKLALGPDGAVPRGTAGAPTWVTGEIARAAGHLMRARADAILVGSATVRDDDPELTCRIPGLAERSPTRIVLASRAGMAAGSRLLATARQVPVWVFSAHDAPEPAVARLAVAGCRIFRVSSVGGGLWLPAVTERLAEEGVTRLLVEGGPAVWAAFARASLVDEVAMFLAGAAGDAPDVLIGKVRRAAAAYLGGLPLEITSQRGCGSDTLVTLRRDRADKPHRAAA